MNRYVNCVGLICLLFPSSSAFGQDAAKLAWPDLIAGIRYERERLHSGIYTAIGTETVPGFAGEQPVKLYSVFSFPDQQMRFEHRGSRPATLNGKQSIRDTFRCIHLAPDRTEHFTSTTTSLMLNIVAPGTMHVKGRDGTRGYLDPRCLGLIPVDKLYDGRTFDKVAAQWESTMSKKTARLADEGEGIVRATILDGGARDTFWIDTRRGFTMIRHLKEAGMIDPATGDFNRLSAAIEKNAAFRERIEEVGIDWRARAALDVPEEVDLSWTQVDDVWVPTSYKHVLVYQQIQKGEPPSKSVLMRHEVALSFDWSAANTTIDNRFFDYHDFKLPIGTEVFDQRGKEPIFLEKIGDLQAAVPMKPMLAKTSRHQLIVIINLAGALIVLSAFLFGRQWRLAKSTVASSSESATPGSQV